MSTQAFIDESGDTGYTKKSSRYFIVTAILTDDVKALRHIIKNIYALKLDKKKSNQLHAYSETDRLKCKLVEKLAVTNIKCFVSVVNKQKTIVKDPYPYALEKIARALNTVGVSDLVIARKDMRKQYNAKIINMFRSYRIHAQFSDSAADKGLQAADFYSWTSFSYLERGNEEYYLKLKHAIVFVQ